jgi:hypothetical protein
VTENPDKFLGNRVFRILFAMKSNKGFINKNQASKKDKKEQLKL